MKVDNDGSELTIDRSRLKRMSTFDDPEEVEYWRQTSYEERLEHLQRLRRMAYGDKIRGRIQRVIEVVES